MHAAIVDLNTDIVVNVVEMGEAGFCPPEGCIVVVSDNANIGDNYVNGAIVPAGEKE